MQLRHPKIKSFETRVDMEAIDDVITLNSKSKAIVDRIEKVLDGLDLTDIRELWAVKGEFWKLGVKALLPEIKCWKIHKLYLWSNRESNILRQIQPIEFLQLKEIHLGWNNIESVESFSFLQTPNLTEIVLRDNQICSAQSLRKCYFPCLKEICLRGNPITSLKLDQIFSPNLGSLNLNKTSLTNQKQIMKLETKVLKQLRFGNLKNISANHQIDMKCQDPGKRRFISVTTWDFK